jgi:branched-chain amino acid transport system permease protein
VVAAAAALLFFLVVPLGLSKTWETQFTTASYFAILALGLNVVVGFAGLLDLGYVAFWAIGAYTTAIVSGAAPVAPFGALSVWWAFPIALAVCMLAGVLLGAPVLRLRGDYLAIVTLGFGEIVRIAAVNMVSITNGAAGLPNIPGFTLFGYHFKADPLPYYYMCVVAIIIVSFVLLRLRESRIGRAWIAIREDEVAAEAMGVDTLKYKLLAFAIGAGVASFAGVIFAANQHFVNPGSFEVIISIQILAMVVLGGMGSMSGVIVGAAAIFLIPEVMRDEKIVGEAIATRAEEYRFLAFGALLVIMMIFRPQGIIPSKRRAREMLHASSDAAAPSIPIDLEGGG